MAAALSLDNVFAAQELAEALRLTLQVGVGSIADRH
jgi:hypothetical protein